MSLVVICRIGEQRVKFPLRDTVRFLPWEGAVKVPLAVNQVEGLICAEGQVFPVFNLTRTSSPDSDPVGGRSGESVVILTRWRSEVVGLLLDKVEGTVDAAGMESSECQQIDLEQVLGREL